MERAPECLLFVVDGQVLHQPIIIDKVLLANRTFATLCVLCGLMLLVAPGRGELLVTFWVLTRYLDGLKRVFWGWDIFLSPEG